LILLIAAILESVLIQLYPTSEILVFKLLSIKALYWKIRFLDTLLQQYDSVRANILRMPNHPVNLFILDNFYLRGVHSALKYNCVFLINSLSFLGIAEIKGVVYVMSTIYSLSNKLISIYTFRILIYTSRAWLQKGAVIISTHYAI